MKAIENVRPQLVPGKLDVTPEGAHFVPRAGGLSVALDPLIIEFLRYCNGSYSINEIVTLMHGKGMPFSFSMIHDYLQRFLDQELWQNAEAFTRTPKSRTPQTGVSQVVASEIPNYLRQVSLFRGLSQSAIEHVASLCQIRKIKYGEKVIERGSKGTEAFALLSGELCVYSHFRTMQDSSPLAVLPPMTVFGESGVISGKARTADVVATSDAVVLSFDVKKIIEPVGSQDVARNLKIRLILGQILKTHPFFRKLPQELGHLFMNCCTIERMTEKMVVVQQGDLGEDFYLIVAGSAVVIKDRAPEANLVAGSYFGEIAALTRGERTATVMTESDCLLLKMNGKNFITVLASNFDMALQIEKIAQERMQEQAGNAKDLVDQELLDEITITSEDAILQLAEDWDLLGGQDEND